MDTMRLRCVMMVIDKRQDALVDDRLCGKEKGQQYARKDALLMIFWLKMI